MKTELILCDDEKQHLQALESLIESYDLDLEITLFENPRALVHYIWKTPGRSRLYLIDICLGEKESGIDLARQIHEADPAAIIIFLSAYLENALDVYDVEHFYFVYKPQEKEKLKVALTRALEVQKKQIRPLLIQENRTILSVPASEIYCLQRIRRWTLITCKSGVHNSSEDLDTLLTKLPDTFHRCHRCYIVNFDRVKTFSGQEFEMENGIRVPIARSHYSRMKEDFTQYLIRERLGV